MNPKLKDLIFSSYEFHDYDPLHTKIIILNSMFFITLIVNTLYIFVNLFITHCYSLFMINFFIVLFVLLALYLLRVKKQHDYAGYIGNLTLFIAFISLALLKEGENYTLIWTFFFAPFAIITLGASRGLMVVFVFIVTLLAIMYTGIGIWQHGSWNHESFLRFSLAHFVMLYAMFAVQKNNENANKTIEKLRQKEKLQLKLLEKLAITDTLTTLHNRRFFEEIFPRQIQRAKSNKELFTFFILDIDYFKQYNDTYGHQKGDWALVQIANILKDVFSKSDDYIFRLGGEEFGGVFLDEDEGNIHFLIAQILKKIHAQKIIHEGNPVGKILTCSIGVYVKQWDERENHQEIYRLADEALYKAKSQGRDQIIYA